MTMLTAAQQLYLKIIDDLHSSWQPHSGQLEIGKEILVNDIKTIFLQCGRKFGKTELAIYLLWRRALLFPGSMCYYVTPEFSHGRKIVWLDPRLSNFGPRKYIASINNTDCLIKFTNGSSIQILGSENFASANGLRPSFLVYDEFCEFHPRFHETMNPNRMVNKCVLLIIGTPPLSDSKNREQYITYSEECGLSKDSIHVVKTSYDNPLNNALELDKERLALFARGEEYIWYSQYMAKITAGGRHVVFPMFDKAKHLVPHSMIIQEISKDLNKLEFYCVVDPGTTTVFAGLFIALNPYSKKIYILDELYAKGAEETATGKVMAIIKAKAYELSKQDLEEDWTKTYDEAGAWFANECANEHEIYFHRTEKHLSKKENGISIIKDILIHNSCKISDRCINLVKETEGYITDADGKFIKKNDHLIDCWRYFLATAAYTSAEAIEASHSLGPRFYDDLNYDNHNKKTKTIDLDDDWTSFYD